MIRAAIAFFILALIAFVLGANGVAGISMEMGQIILIAALIFAGLSFLASLATGKKTSHLP